MALATHLSLTKHASRWSKTIIFLLLSFTRKSIYQMQLSWSSPIHSLPSNSFLPAAWASISGLARRRVGTIRAGAVLTWSSTTVRRLISTFLFSCVVSIPAGRATRLPDTLSASTWALAIAMTRRSVRSGGCILGSFAIFRSFTAWSSTCSAAARPRSFSAIFLCYSRFENALWRQRWEEDDHTTFVRVVSMLTFTLSSSIWWRLEAIRPLALAPWRSGFSLNAFTLMPWSLGVPVSLAMLWLSTVVALLTLTTSTSFRSGEFIFISNVVEYKMKTTTLCSKCFDLIFSVLTSPIYQLVEITFLSSLPSAQAAVFVQNITYNNQDGNLVSVFDGTRWR